MKSESYEEFLYKIKLHNDWNDSGGKIGTFLKLDNGNFPGIKLSQKRLDSAMLYRVNFENAYLEEVDMFGCYLLAASLNGANLKSSNLSKATLDNSSLINANLVNVTACKASFCNANLCGADLTGADLRSTSFFEANLENAILKNANLEMVSFNKARLYKTNLKGALGLEKTFNKILENRKQIPDHVDKTFDKWIDIGPEGSPIILKNDEMYEWLIKAAE